jgi:hypothetical protein
MKIKGESNITNLSRVSIDHFNLCGNVNSNKIHETRNVLDIGKVSCNISYFCIYKMEAK